MKIYVHKYAITQGIVEMEATPVMDGYVMLDWSYLRPRDYSLTMENAVAQAEIKREKKIKSLTKQLRKLETLTFEAVK